MNKRLLLIEDEHNIGKALSDSLTLYDYETTWVDNGKAAINTINSKQFDLIICDINLPDTNGYAILSHVRNETALYNIPFIFLTAYTDAQDVRKGMNEGADDYITKPFSLSTIIEAVESKLSKKQRDVKFFYDNLHGKWLELLTDNFNHEFLTPLNGIITANYLLEMSLPQKKVNEVKDLISAINVAGVRMLRNTKKILTFALLTSKSEELVEITAYENIDVQELLLQSIKYFEEQYFPTWDKVKVFTEQVGKFYCNEEYFKLIIDELLDNMIKFHTGESFPTIVLKPIDKGFSLSFINEVDKPTSLSSTEIQPFNKFHNDMSKSGLGIGLYVTKRLCQLMKLQLKTEQENGIINIELSTY